MNTTLETRIARTGLALAILAILGLVVAGCGTDASQQAETTKRTPPIAQSSPPVQTPVSPPPATAISQGSAEDATVEPGVTHVAETTAPRVVSYEDAERAFFQRDYDDAVALFTAYVQRKPANPWGFYMLGLSSWKAGNLEAAEAALKRAAEVDASHVKTFINLARVQLDGNRAAEALLTLDRALELDSASGVAIRLCGRAHHQLGQTDEAIHSYRRAIALDPSDAWSMNNLALIFIEQENYDDALPALARAVAVDGTVAVFQNNLGMALEHAGDYTTAAQAYQRAIDINGDYDRAQVNLARVSEITADPYSLTVDLPSAAARFEDLVATWGEATAAIPAP